MTGFAFPFATLEPATLKTDFCFCFPLLLPLFFPIVVLYVKRSETI